MLSVLNDLFLFCRVILSLQLFCLINQGRIKARVGRPLVGWLFWALRPFETVFQSISGRLPKEREKEERKG